MMIDLSRRPIVIASIITGLIIIWAIIIRAVIVVPTILLGQSAVGVGVPSVPTCSSLVRGIMASTSIGACASVVLSGRLAVAIVAVSELGNCAIATILGKKVLKLGDQFFQSVSIQMIILIVKDI